MWINKIQETKQSTKCPATCFWFCCCHTYLSIHLLIIENKEINDGGKKTSKGSRKDVLKNIKETKSKEGSPHRIKDV